MNSNETSKPKTIRRKLLYGWLRWTRPSKSIHLAEERRLSRLTTTIILILIPFFVFREISLLFYDPFASSYALLILSTSLIFIAIFLYGLSRSTRYFLAAQLVVFTLSIYPFALIFLSSDHDLVQLYNALFRSFVAIFIGSILLPIKQTIFQSIIILALILILPLVMHDIPFFTILQPFSLVTFLSVSIIFYRLYLSDVANDRTEKENQLHLEVKKSEEQYRLLFEQAPIGMAITTPNGRFQNVNAAYCQAVGYTPEELFTMTFMDITHPEDNEKNQVLQEKLLKREIQNFALEKRYIHKSGTIIHAIINVSLESTDEIRTPRVLAQIIDISNQKHIENRLKENQLLLSGITENSTALIYVKDINGRYIFVNKAFEEATSYSRENIIRKTDFDLFPAGIANDFQETDQLILTGKESTIQLEEKLPVYWHNKATLLTSKFPLFDEEGNIYAVAGISTDITEQKKNMLVLRQQKAQLETLRQVSLRLTAELDIDTLLGAIIANAVDILNVDVGSLWLYDPEMDMLVLDTNHRSDFPINTIARGEGASGKVLETGSPIIINNYANWEGQLNMLDTKKVSQAVAVVPVFNNEEIIGVISIGSMKEDAFDQSHIHLLELIAAQAAVAINNARLHAQLKQHSEKLELSNKELQDFAYVSSHDLQEPLRKIQTFADRLQDRYADQMDQKGLDYLARMQSAASRMQMLIVDLLTFSRITTQARPFAMVDLNQVIAAVRLDLELLIEESRAQIRVDRLPKLEADETQMTQLFLNLISNAIKFKAPDQNPNIIIEDKTTSEGVQTGLVKIAVSDNGIGFDEKYTKRIFGVFQRLHNRETYEGTGVGLAICQKIVSRHHGNITATSQPGEGATFTIVLPIRQN